MKKRKYTTFGNLCFIYKDLWKYDKSKVIYAIIEVLLQVTVGFGAILLPSMMIRLLEVKTPIEQMIYMTMGIFAAYGVVSAVATYFVRRNQMQYIDYRCGHLIRSCGRKVISIDYAQYEDEKIQKLMQNAMNALGGNNVGLESMLHQTVMIATKLIGMLLYALLLTQVHPLLIVLLVTLSLIQVLCFRAANRYELKNKDQKAGLEVTKRYFERQAYDVSSGKDIRLYQLQHWLTKKYQQANKKYQSLIAKERTHYFANDLIGLALQFLRDIICYGYLIQLLKDGMEVSNFVLYIGLVTSFSMYFNEITNCITQFERSQKLFDFFREFMDIKTVFHHGDGETLDDKEATFDIEFSHVSFSYPSSKENKEAKLILDDISFRINKGEKLALVGINGAGKTTIVKLICGFYHPTSGHIYINGIDLTELDLDDYYQHLAVVFQEAFTYSFSIGENVTCLQEGNYDEEKCIDALIKAGLWDKIDALQKKEKTCLNKDIEEDGIQLSGGQLQKLMLARALYKECKLLLLDEPTAALDAIAENEMYQKYDEVIAGKTALFISHRLASTRFCSQILFLENGKIVESGTHQELMEAKGQYAYMFEVQSQYYKKGGAENEGQIVMEYYLVIIHT